MPQDLEHKIVALLIGAFLGMLLMMSIKYPVHVQDVEKYAPLCADRKIDRVKVNVAGSIYSVECANGVQLKVH